MGEIQIMARHTDWLLILLLVAIFLILAARRANPERFAVFQKLPFHIKGKEVAHNYNPLLLAQGHDFMATLAATVILISAVFWLSQSKPNQEYQAFLFEPLRYLQIAIVIVAFVLIKGLLSSLVASVFDVKNFIIASQNRSFAFLTWLSLPVFPVLFAVIFVSAMSAIGYYSLYVLLVVGYLYATFQSFQLIWQMPGTIVHKFLYLCTLEAIPFLFLAKWLNSL